MASATSSRPSSWWSWRKGSRSPAGTSSRARSRSSSPRRRPRSARASAACTRCGAIRTARSAASAASCARRCARRSRSRSRPPSARTRPVAPPGTTSTSPSASSAGSARSPVRSTRSSRPTSSSTTARSAATCTTRRRCCSPSATGTKPRSPGPGPLTLRTGDGRGKPPMNFETAVFYIFAAILLYAGIRTITCRNPVHAALHLVLAFFTAAAIWLVLRAEFLAITLVLVYVCAVMVRFLFVVMMLDINLDVLREGFWRALPLAATVGVLMVVEMVLVLADPKAGFGDRAAPVDPGASFSNTKALGEVLYTDYVYPFELAAVLLLVAIVVAIALTMRKRKDTKYQDPARQVAVRREERIRIVSMPVEKRD